mgnify:CR=1 FL=1
MENPDWKTSLTDLKQIQMKDRTNETKEIELNEALERVKIEKGTEVDYIPTEVELVEHYDSETKI